MAKNQINVKLTDRHMRVLEELTEQYGTISSVIRIALENLYERTFPERAGSLPAAELEEETGSPVGRK